MRKSRFFCVFLAIVAVFCAIPFSACGEEAQITKETWSEAFLNAAVNDNFAYESETYVENYGTRSVKIDHTEAIYKYQGSGIEGYTIFPDKLGNEESVLNETNSVVTVWKKSGEWKESEVYLSFDRNTGVAGSIFNNSFVGLCEKLKYEHFIFDKEKGGMFAKEYDYIFFNENNGIWFKVVIENALVKFDNNKLTSVEYVKKEMPTDGNGNWVDSAYVSVKLHDFDKVKITLPDGVKVTPKKETANKELKKQIFSLYYTDNTSIDIENDSGENTSVMSLSFSGNKVLIDAYAYAINNYETGKSFFCGLADVVKWQCGEGNAQSLDSLLYNNQSEFPGIRNCGAAIYFIDFDRLAEVKEYSYRFVNNDEYKFTINGKTGKDFVFEVMRNKKTKEKFYNINATEIVNTADIDKAEKLLNEFISAKQKLQEYEGAFKKAETCSNYSFSIKNADGITEGRVSDGKMWYKSDEIEVYYVYDEVADKTTKYVKYAGETNWKMEDYFDGAEDYGFMVSINEILRVRNSNSYNMTYDETKNEFKFEYMYNDFEKYLIEIENNKVTNIYSETKRADEKIIKKITDIGTTADITLPSDLPGIGD